MTIAPRDSHAHMHKLLRIMSRSAVPRRLTFALLGTVLLLAACSGARLGPRVQTPPVRLATAVEHALPDPGYDVEHYELEIVLEPERRSIEGRCRVFFTATRPELDALHLDLVGLTVRSVEDSEGRPLAFRHEADDLAIRLSQPLAQGAPADVTIRYGGPPATGLWYSGRRADGTGPTQVFTQGEAEHNRGWFPCFDHPSDRATTDLTLTMPASWIAVCPGERMAVEEGEDGTRTERWSMQVPHPSYLVSLVAGEFASLEGDWEGVPLQFLAEPRYRDWMAASFEKTPDVLTFLSNLTQVRYPYPKYSQACVANFPWGGMENISATTLTPRTLGDERARRDRDSTDLIAHEAAHQWFGDLLTARDWSEIWLNEGFATLMTLLYKEEREGLDAFRIAMRDAQDAYTEEDRGSARRPTVTTVWRDPEDLMDTRAYAGAAARLNLLRFQLGEETFLDGLRAYVAENVGRSVTTADFQRAMEKVSGRGLEGFFQQWFFAPGYPEFELDWSFDRHAKTVSLDVRQVQATGDGTPAVFRVPVELVVRDEGGSVSHRVELTKRRERFEFPVAGRPIYVRFDHGSWIPKRVHWKDRGVRELLAIAHEDDDVTGRRDAVRELGERAGELYRRGGLEELETIAAELVDRLGRDSSPAVRAAAATALGQARTLEARERLLAAAFQDPEPAVRIATLEALAEFGENADLAAAGKAAFDEGLSWGTMAAGAKLVAHAAPSEAYGYLTQKLFLDSPHDVLRAALLEELGALRNEGVDEQLRRWARDDSVEEAARAAALRALGSRPRERARNLRFVREFLADESFAVRWAAVEVLCDYATAEVRRWLRDYYPLSRTAQERRRIERALASPGLAPV